jgi:dTDP-4-dehydrorhamnose reductase
VRSPERSDIILLTGATGQLGFAWTEHLRSQAMTVLTPDRNSMDLASPETVRTCLNTFQPTYIIHCGAYTKVDLAEDEPDVCMRINSDSTAEMARYAADNDVPLVYYSTDYIFPGLESDKNTYPKGYPVHAEASPSSVYGNSKWQGEIKVRESLGDYLIIRVAWLCGAYGTNFVKTMIRLGASRTEINVVNDQIGSPSFVHDVVDFTDELLRRGVSGTRHISSKGVISWAEFAAEVFDYSGMNVNVIPIPSSDYPTKATRPLYSKLDCQQTEHDSGRRLPDWKHSLHQLIDEISLTK